MMIQLDCQCIQEPFATLGRLREGMLEAQVAGVDVGGASDVALQAVKHGLDDWTARRGNVTPPNTAHVLYEESST